MMSTNIDPEVMRTLVSQVIKELKEKGAGTSCPAPTAAATLYGVFPTMSECIDASTKAQEVLLFQTPATRQKWVEVIRHTCLDKRNMEMMSRMAVEETAIGRYEDKIIKNTAAAKYTPGIEDLSTDARTGGHGKKQKRRLMKVKRLLLFPLAVLNSIVIIYR